MHHRPDARDHSRGWDSNLCLHSAVLHRTSSSLQVPAIHLVLPSQLVSVRGQLKIEDPEEPWATDKILHYSN